MAVRKTFNFLPGVFQTDVNKKFLSATVDQLVAEPELRNLNGYIGRSFAPTYKTGDSYIIESDELRQKYQLEPGIVVRNEDDQTQIDFFASYIDLLNKIKYYGGLIDNQDRLFESEYYTYDPLISFDKFVNFSQYYWLPDGPDTVDVNTTGVEITKTITVTRDVINNRYIFSSDDTINNTLILARGGTYTFVVDQPGHQFWIQTELGLDGRKNVTPTISTRDILGVTNNGEDSGVVTFTVPQATAQDRFTQMKTVFSVDYAAPLPYSDLHNNLLSVFLDNYPQYAGITGNLDGKYVIFVDQGQFNNLGESVWTANDVIDANGNVISGFGISSVSVADYGAGYFSANATATFSAPDLSNGIPAEGTPVLTVVGVTITSGGSGYEVGDILTVTSGTNSATFKVNTVDANTAVASVSILSGGTFESSAPTGAQITSAVPSTNRFDCQLELSYGIVGVTITEVGSGYTGSPTVTFGGANTSVALGSVTKTNNRFEPGAVVPDSQRFGVWKVQYINIGGNDPLVRLVPFLNIAIDEKVYVKYGIGNANREFYKDYTGFMVRVPIITSVQNTLYIQDGSEAGISAEIQIVDPTGWTIDVENEILGKATYTSPNGVEFTSGLKIKFGTDVTPESYQNKIYYVENVGDFIKLVDVNSLATPERYNDENRLNYPDQVFPEYITIKRDHPDLNSWSRNNRWFHRDVIAITSVYNNTTPVFNQDQRAQRPIIQFETDLQLFNSGRIGKQAIDILVVEPTDAFTQLNGVVLESAYGVTLYSGIRILFANDVDPDVKNKIYVLNLVQYSTNEAGVPIGPKYIDLVKAEDGDVEQYDTVVVLNGEYKGTTWWYNGSDWTESQEKTQVQQAPLFEVLDPDGVSFSNLTKYVRSSFAGTKIFGYSQGTGTDDIILGFPLKYRNFTTQGDIEFTNFYGSNSFTYVQDQTEISTKLNTGFLQRIVDRNTLVPKTIWRKIVEPTRQYQLITYVYDGTNSPFAIDVDPSDLGTIPNLKIYKNNAWLSADSYSYADRKITLLVDVNLGDKIDILVYSTQISKLGKYEIPINLDLNPQNIDIENLTLGQIRNHLVTLGQNSTQLIGDILGSSNLRDIEIKQQGGNILQQSAPVPYAVLFLLSDKLNFVDSIRFAAQEYTKFKNKFLELSTSLKGVDPNDPAKTLDVILSFINDIKNPKFPWYYSDMVPYGTYKNVIPYTVFDPLRRDYEITNVFNDQELSNLSVLVYLTPATDRNDGEWPAGVKRQLIKDQDYVFRQDLPAVTFLDGLDLQIDDVIEFIEYPNTDGSYIPETPSKLGLYPKFIPVKYRDNSYRTPVDVIKGHDGSITPAFGDFRDDLLLELEKRIYNNIKLPDTGTYQDIYEVVPGKFRNNSYSLEEANRLLSKSFLAWVGNNKLDYSANDTFESNDPFTWNYGRFVDKIEGNLLPGSWRACYQYYYDTTTPHLTPWEMLGFAEKPLWWEDEYGPAPYTGGNQYLWDDLEAGIIRQGAREGVDENFARPGLRQVIPVDDNGFLKNPAQILTDKFNSSRASGSWSVGQQGPVEYSWRKSSDFPFSIQIALAIAKPAKYFSIFLDTYRYKFNFETNQFVTDQNVKIKQTSFTFNGDTSSGSIHRSAGYLNYIADFLVNQGIDPSKAITPYLKNFEVNLAYKMAGFSDQKYLRVLAEQNSPSSTNDSIIIPNENYDVYLFKSTPIQKISYSSVIVEKSTNGWTVRGYNLGNPYFTIIPSVVNSNSYKIRVLNKEATVYNNFQNLKLTVPYGYEFETVQQVADFLISYERYLISQGFVFVDTDETLQEQRNWKLSVKEFLYWVQQGWKSGSILVLSPIADSVRVLTTDSVVDEVADSQYGSKVLDQNFKLIKNVDYSVMRNATDFKLTLNIDAAIGYIELDLVQYEHVLLFDNTTVFNDIIYKPELGSRQFRLKLIGQKTANWDGSLTAPGFIYISGDIPLWLAGKDYLKGDLVNYKNQNYVALQNIPASTAFEFNYWQVVALNELKKGLLPNFSTLAVKSQDYYNSYVYFNSDDQLKYSHGLIGFKPRQYLTDLGLSDTAQIELYKGYIRQKGSSNAITQLTRAIFNNLNSNINYYEEWAVRVGEYGALSINPLVEIALDEKEFSVNPGVARFVDDARSNEANGITIFNKKQLFKSNDQYNGNIALLRNDSSTYENDIPSAGYVAIDDVDTTIFDLTNYNDLDDKLSEIGSGYTIWVAKDFTNDWNVFRVTETATQIISLSNSLDGYITFTTKTPHGLNVNDVFLVRGFDEQYNGFYQVYKKVDLTSVTVLAKGSTTGLTTVEGLGSLFRLDSLRFLYMEDARQYTPLNGWKVGEKIWIDVDAATSSVQGQLYDVPNNTWKVYEKTRPWSTSQSLEKSASDYVSNDGYGTSVKISDNGLQAAVGSPYSTEPTFGMPTGLVTTFSKNGDDEFQVSLQIAPDAYMTREFGHAIDFSTNTESTKLAVGSPKSRSNVGYVYIYNLPIGTTVYEKFQVIAGNVNAAGRFGSSIAFDQTGRWLYVGAPEEDTVYIYGFNSNVTERITSVSIDNDYYLELSGTITANIGQVITQDNSPTKMIVRANITASSNVKVSTLVNALIGNVSYNPGNVFINTINDNGDIISTANANVWPINSLSASVTNSITLPYTPQTTDPAALLIYSRNSTLVPGAEYIVIGNVINFTSNLAPDDYVIRQHPYYSFVTSIKGNLGSKFGYAVDSSYDGAQLAVGAPDDNVGFQGNTFIKAGAVYVYDRVIEAFNTTGESNYTTRGNIDTVRRVTIDDIEISESEFSVPNSNTLSFNVPPPIGKIAYVETNQFNLLEILTGSIVQGNAAFGTSLTICSNNCAIYVGAPYYDNGEAFNTGAVFKFHNRGRLYGTNTGDHVNPTFVVGDFIRLDNFEVIVTGNVSSINTLTDGSNYSEGVTVVIDDTDSEWGTRATADVSVYSGNGKIKSISLTNSGSGYYFTPNVSIVKPANVSVIESAVDGSNLIIESTSGIYTGMRLFGNAWTGTEYITYVYSDSIVGISSANTAPIGDGVVFADIGSGATANATITSQATLDSFIRDINSAEVLGVSAVNEGGKLRINSNKTVAKNLLRILSGNNVNNPLLASTSAVLADAGMKVFAEMQIILSPFNNLGEYFGSKVILASNAYMLVISSERGTTKTFTTFDEETTEFDRGSTGFFGIIPGSGSVYIYELYDDPRDNVEHPGRYAFAQQLDPGTLNPGDQFGTSIDIYDTSLILVGAPADDTITFITLSAGLNVSVGDLITQPTAGYAEYEVISVNGTTLTVTPRSSEGLSTGASYLIYLNGNATSVYIVSITNNTGSVYVFTNPTRQRGWNLIRYQEDKVDIESVNRMFLYDNISNTILTNLEFIDPSKGKILGLADQEITYKTGYDPAVYNRGTDTKVNLNTDIYWTDNQVGQVWWNLEQVRFLDYEQSSLEYRSINWGGLFPGSNVEICEWVESSVLPSQYVEAGGDGVPKYPNNTAYVEVAYVDPISNIIGSKYYFWVTDRTGVNPNNPARKLPTIIIKDYIENPKGQNLPYAAVIRQDAVSLYNIGEYLSASDTVLHIDYELIKNSSIIHSEYELIQKGNPTNQIPTKIVNKLIDSLAGIDVEGSVVPDPKLSPADQYGILSRPRQSMFIDRLKALNDMILFVNNLMLQTPVARQHDLSQLYTEESEPSEKLSEFDEKVPTDIELGYLDVNRLPVGYKVLVENDTTQDGLWILYQLTSAKKWEIAKVQSYKTDLYWDLVDWFALRPDGVTRYSINDQLDYVVPTLVDALKLTPEVGAELLVRITTGAGGGWNLLVVNAQGGYDVVGIEKGTLQFAEIGNFDVNGLGFGNQGYDANRYDQNPNIEIRYIMNALKDDIFNNELQGEFNNLFFVLINYLFTEQKYIDWMFKTSFISVTHRLRELTQFSNYVKDNQDYYQEYINEVKPYRTSIREYLIEYNGLDLFEGSATDFDLPPYYDSTNETFRSPNGEGIFADKDAQRWLTFPYNQWYENRKHKVQSVLIEDGGSGYLTAPIVTIVGGGDGVISATARAVIDGDTGSVIRIDILSGGEGYTRTPTVIINGSNETPARAYAVLNNLQTRTFDTTIKFDRINYQSTVKEWHPNTAYTTSDVITYAELNGNILVRNAWKPKSNLTSGSAFIASDYNRFAANAFTNANDRIIGYYQPRANMPARDLNQLVYGIEYPGVIVTGPDFNQTPGFSGTSKLVLTANVNITANVGDFITQDVTDADAAAEGLTLYANIQLTQATSGNAVVIGKNQNNEEFVINGNVLRINGTAVAAKPTDYDFITSKEGPRFDLDTFDNIDYDEDGNPILSESVIDTIIRSSYTDTGLGLRPEDINVDGGSYVDTYSSHAPEELIPGIMFDTLEMRVFTRIDGNTRVLGYRIFNNMRREITYTRMADRYSARLSSNLGRSDTLIPVFDATVLPLPNPTLGIPGIVFINGERITYYRNYALEVVDWRNDFAYASGSILRYGNVLTLSGEITTKAGDYIVQPTTGANAQVLGNIVSNSSVAVKFINGNVFNYSDNVQVISRGNIDIKLSGNISANVGDIITQVGSGAQARVISSSTTDIVSVTPYSIDGFNNANVTITLNGIIVANVGSFINQFISGANLIVVATAGGNTVQARYLNTTSLITGSGNISLNGVDQPVYPTEVVTSGTAGKIKLNNVVTNLYTYSNVVANINSITDTSVYPTANTAAYFIAKADMAITGSFDYTRAEHLPDINVLGQLRRGTEGTAIANVHPRTSFVVDASIQQIIPNATHTENVTFKEITALTIKNAGFGYTQTANIVIDDPAGGSNTAIGTMSVYPGNGIISSVTLLSSGSGYTQTPNVTIQKSANVTVGFRTVTANVLAFDNITNTLTVDKSIDPPIGTSVAVDGIPLNAVITATDPGNNNVSLSTTNIGTVSGSALFYLSSGNVVIVNDSTGIVVGQSLLFANVPSGTYVTLVSGSTIYLDKNVTGNVTGTGTFFDPGTGGEIVATMANTSSYLQTATTRTYTLKLNGEISANIGDIVTQSGSNANATVYGVNTSANTSVLTISYNSAAQFANANIVLQMSGNITANVGDYITQPINGTGNIANLIVISSVSGNANVTAKYVDVYPLVNTRFANIKVNGSWLSSNVYPKVITEVITGINSVAKNGMLSNLYPLTTKLSGYVNGLDSSGNITVSPGTILSLSNSWYNLGVTTVTDGTGFEGATTEQVLFLKDAVATDISEDTAPGNEFLTEDAVNTLITEIGNVTIIGD